MRLDAGRVARRALVEVTDMLYKDDLMSNPPAMAELVGGLLSPEHDEAEIGAAVVTEMNGEAHAVPSAPHPSKEAALLALAVVEAETEE